MNGAIDSRRKRTACQLKAGVNVMIFYILSPKKWAKSTDDIYSKWRYFRRLGTYTIIRWDFKKISYLLAENWLKSPKRVNVTLTIALDGKKQPAKSPCGQSSAV
jgi:hypothetical protein